MTHTSSKRHALPFCTLVSLSVLSLGGCAIVSPETSDVEIVSFEPRLQREHRLQSTWRGRSYHALIEAYGTPKMVMGLPSPRPVDTSVVVYGVIDRASECIDAFMVVADKPNGDLTVSDYFCR